MKDHSKEYLTLMLSLVQEAGRLAMKHIDHNSVGFKKDSSVITKADTEISRLFQGRLAITLKDPAHLLLDEEDPRMGEYLDQQRLDRTSFLWALDPIDGTRPYANRMPFFGVSIGLIKEGKPWLGAVYFPALNELFYCDGKQAYFVQKAFSSSARKTKIAPIQEPITSKSLFFCNDTFFNKFAWKDKNFHILINACAVVNLCWPAVGRGMGCFIKSHLWDLAGSWPILLKAGLDFRCVKTGKVMDHVHAGLFNRSPKPWELKDYYLVSSQEHYAQIKGKMILQTK